MTPTLSPIHLCMCAAVTLSAAVGCGSGDQLYPVEGRVLLEDGTPLNRGWITLEPVERHTGGIARGDIDATGNFSVGTHKPGDGARAGEYRAAISAPIADGVYEKLETVDPKFGDYATSGLTCRVTEDAEQNKFTFTVARPGKAHLLGKK